MSLAKGNNVILYAKPKFQLRTSCFFIKVSQTINLCVKINFRIKSYKSNSEDRINSNQQQLNMSKSTLHIQNQF